MPGSAVPDPGGRSSVLRSSTVHLRCRIVPAATAYQTVQSIGRTNYQCIQPIGFPGPAGAISSRCVAAALSDPEASSHAHGDDRPTPSPMTQSANPSEVPAEGFQHALGAIL